jgi:hypothetical protein
MEAQPVQGDPEFEGRFREVVRRDVAPMRKPQADGESEIGAPSVNALLQQIAGSTFKEIDRLIDELRGLRHLLQCEGERVQREIVKYAHLSQAAMNSTRVIAEGMTQLQGTVDATQKGR